MKVKVQLKDGRARFQTHLQQAQFQQFKKIITKNINNLNIKQQELIRLKLKLSKYPTAEEYGTNNKEINKPNTFRQKEWNENKHKQ